tara:strand:+ start:641 stop:1993 length:1353 start_codon:yes stop_codon:yes gene_type:complete
MDSNINIPTNFVTLINDFTNDLITTFPEHSNILKRWTNSELTDSEQKVLFNYCTKTYPERFFDILYQNEEIFEEEKNINTCFLPQVDFAILFKTEDISETTKKAMWKYLQLVLFTVLGEIKDKKDFGDTMNIFDGIEEEDLQAKMKDTMSSITDFFKNVEENVNNNETEDNTDNSEDNTDKTEEFKNMFESSGNMDDFKEKMKEKIKGMPSMQKLQEHLSSLFDGKIGKLAKEMAEEIADDFKDILGNENEQGDIKGTQDILKKLMKDPKKITNLMKTVGSKLDSKMKSGEISKDELMKEAGDLMGKMKDMGGDTEFNNIFKNLAKNMGGLGKNMKMDTNALKRMTERNTKIEKMKERSEKRKQDKIQELEKIKKEQERQLKIQEDLIAKYKLNEGTNPNEYVFSLDGEKQEKSSIHDKLLEKLEEDLINDDEVKTTSKTNKKKKRKAKK